MLLLQVNLVEWLKNKVTNRDYEAIVDPKLPEKPSSKALKKALLVALRCVDPDSQKRPKMGHVIHMLEVDDFPYREVSPVASSGFFTCLVSTLLCPSQSCCSFARNGRCKSIDPKLRYIW